MAQCWTLILASSASDEINLERHFYQLTLFELGVSTQISIEFSLGLEAGLTSSNVLKTRWQTGTSQQFHGPAIQSLSTSY